MDKHRFGTLPRRKIIAVLLVLVLSLAGLANTRIASTTATWTERSNASAQFSAASLGPVKSSSFQCFDIDSGLLGTKLLSNELLFTWDDPIGFEDRPMEYRITWDGGILGAKGEARITDGTNQYKYRAVLLGQILSFNIDFKVYPVYGTWEGPPTTYTARTISLLLSVTMDC